MQLRFTPDEEALRAELREYFGSEFPESIRRRSAEGTTIVPDDIVATMRHLNSRGLAVPGWPVEHGGRDWTPVQHHIWREEMALNFIPEILSFNAGMVGPVIAEFGSDEQKAKYLAATANIDIWWCQGFSEPEAGSDLASLKTRAVRDGDHYVVNGQKTWTTLGQYADWIFMLVRTDPNVKKQAGISFLLIDLATPGIEMRPIQLIDGGFEVNEVFFEDVRVPVANRVGDENAGWTIAKFLLGNERSGIARVGATKARIARAKRIATQIKTPDGTLLDDPAIARRFAALENQLFALEITQLRVVAGSANGKQNPASSLLKLRGSQLQQDAAELLADIAGADSLPVAGMGEPGATEDISSPLWAQRSVPSYLNRRKVTIYGGSSEIQRQIIAKSVLGL